MHARPMAVRYRGYGHRFLQVLAGPPPGWTGEPGFITPEVFKRHPPPPPADHEYFICGPDVMMDAIEAALGQMKVLMSKYHSESFV